MDVQFSAVRLILILIFNTTTSWGILSMILLIAGSWKLLEKSGLKGWWALIPGAREYQLSRCAGREPEGRIWSVITMLKWVVNLIAETPPILRILNASAATLIFLTVIVVPLTLISLVYALRVFAGLTEVYGVRKRWLLLWFLFAGITAVIWGFHRDFQPAWKVAELNAALAELAAVGDVSVMDDGLTVNLQERSTTEFFQKKMLLRDIHMHIPQGQDRKSVV